jgi:hypothetical protein
VQVVGDVSRVQIPTVVSGSDRPGIEILEQLQISFAAESAPDHSGSTPEL